MAIHEVAAAGFGRSVGEYERARPGYPDAVIDLLATTGALAPERIVVDVAAGTGKLTRQLSPSGAQVVAVEPLASMGEALVGTTMVAAGTAEALPLRTGSAHLLTVAQAFHWFDEDPALAELVRVVRPGGWAALLWNERDESVPWVKTFGDIIERHGGGRPYTPARSADWDAVLRRAGCSEVRSVRIDHAVPATRSSVVERAASTSFVAALPDDQRAACLAEVAGLVGGMAESFTFPHITDVHLARTPGGT